MSAALPICCEAMPAWRAGAEVTLHGAVWFPIKAGATSRRYEMLLLPLPSKMLHHQTKHILPSEKQFASRADPNLSKSINKNTLIQVLHAPAIFADLEHTKMTSLSISKKVLPTRIIS